MCKQCVSVCVLCVPRKDWEDVSRGVCVGARGGGRRDCGEQQSVEGHVPPNLLRMNTGIREKQAKLSKGCEVSCGVSILSPPHRGK